MTNEENSRNIDKDKKQKKKRPTGIAAFSLLITLFDRLGEIIYEAILNSFCGKIFTSYTSLRKKLSTGICATLALKSGRIKRMFRKIRRFLAGRLDSCISISLANKFIHKSCSFPLQFYGNFGLFFGIYTIVVYCVKRFIPYFTTASTTHLFVGISVTVVSIPLIFSRVSLATAVKNSIIGRHIFKDSFGFSDEVFDTKKTTIKSRGNFMLLLGLVTGLSTFFIQPITIIALISIIILMFLIASYPEIGVLLSIVSIPFLYFFSAPTVVLSILVLITTFFTL